LNQEVFSLKDRVAIVTGATSGIGKAIAIGFAGFGADVVIAGRNLSKAKDVSEQIENLGRKSLVVKTSVGNADDVTRMVDTVIGRFAKIDILVNSAGISRIEGPSEDVSEQDWDDTINTNLKGRFLCAKAVAPHMISQRRGKIINLASIDGIIGVQKEAAYCTSKGGLTKTLAVEWAKYNICVNAIAPSDVETEMYHEWSSVIGEEYVTYAHNRTSLSRARGTIPQPNDVASAALFLASDASDWITGYILCIDGGCTTSQNTH